MVPAIASALHILGVALAFGMVIGREFAMREPFDDQRRAELFRADNWTGIAAMILIGAGLWRLLEGFEKPTIWYMRDNAFFLKMGLLAVLMSLEMYPMITFIRWRVREKKGLAIDLRPLPRIRLINRIEIVGYVAIIVTAATMAHGAWHRAPSSDPACAVEDAIATRCLGCHGSSGTQGGLAMDRDVHGALVGRPSSQWSTSTLVVPGDPAGSLLYLKLTAQQGIRGVSMPMGQPTDPALAALVERWIREGAKTCER